MNRVLERVKLVWAQERIELRRVLKIVKGTIAKRVKDAIAELTPIDPELAKQATAILSRHEDMLRNLTAEMTACRGNDACEEVVGEKQWLLKRKVKEKVAEMDVCF